MAATHGTGQSHAIEDYAKSIYSLQQRAGGDPVSANTLAERYGMTPASASAMVKKLAERGLAIHEPYHGVRLTPDGERLALEMLRHHRLLELYLAERLDVPWDRVHEEAEALEHVLSEDLRGAHRRQAREPDARSARRSDPRPRPRHLRGQDRLARQPAGRGRRALRARVDSDQAILRYLAERGIAIGDDCPVSAREPFGGPITVRFGGAEHVLGGMLAGAMRIELDPPAAG